MARLSPISGFSLPAFVGSWMPQWLHRNGIWPDHTYVSVDNHSQGWGCAGRKAGGTLIAGSSGTGDVSVVDCIAQPDERAGIAPYGVDGVCHQMANRMLYPVGTDVSAANWYRDLELLYGAFGNNMHLDWAKLKSRCMPGATATPDPDRLREFDETIDEYGGLYGDDSNETSTDVAFLRRVLPQTPQQRFDHVNRIVVLAELASSRVAGADDSPVPERSDDSLTEAFMLVETEILAQRYLIPEFLEERDDFPELADIRIQAYRDRHSAYESFCGGQTDCFRMVDQLNEINFDALRRISAVLGPQQSRLWLGVERHSVRINTVDPLLAVVAYYGEAPSNAANDSDHRF